MSDKRRIYCVFYVCKDTKKIAGIFTNLGKAAEFCNDRFLFEKRTGNRAKIKRMEIILPEENAMFSPGAMLPIAWMSFEEMTDDRPRWGGEEADIWDKKLKSKSQKNRQI